MRKPLVVVCTAALLLAGGVVATSAGADETPDVPGLGGFWWPSAWSFGGDSVDDGIGPDDDDQDSIDDSSDDDRVLADPFSDRGPAERPALDDSTVTDADADADAAVRPHAGRPMAGHARARGGAATADQAQPQRPVAAAERPAPTRAQRPAAAQQRSGSSAQRPGSSAQRPATNVMAAARRAVTSRDVSASPAAPVQQRILVLINQNRRRGGCAPISLDGRLIRAANRHAADMARRGYFEHESPNGESAGDRVSEAGYDWKRYGENIARGADSAWEVVDGWMNSPAHRRNIMDCRLHQMGIGLALSRHRGPYWVQDFATPARR